MICVLTDAIMQSVENALLIGEISFVMMLLRGQACRWGTGSHMKAGKLLVSRKKTELAGGEVIFTYRLAGNGYTWVPWEDNPDYTGMSFVGSIVGTQGEQVEVAFDIDKTAAGGNRYGFAPATGNLMYCMPQKGTKTSLYIGNGDEAQGIATGCIRTNGSICEGTGSPEKKSFRSEHGKGMDLYPQSMGLDGGETGKITFEDETGTTIESNGGLVLMAKEGIRLESMTGIAMQGMSDIMALYAEGASSLCVNGSVDMLGRRTSLAGTVYQGYDPFEDVPQKGEFDWGGFARNLAIGLGVAIACVGLALIPGIGPIVTGALIGAAIGTFCQTVYKANEEWQSGNVRSTIETVRDVVISAAAGGFTGACVVAFPVTVLFSGEIYAGVSLTGRATWALGDSSMNNEKKMAYIFDTKQMAVDFSIGALIGIIVPGAVARKVASNEAKNPVLDETRNSHINGNYGSPDKVDNLLSGRPELSGSSRDKLLTTVQNSELRKIVNELYRPGASVGDGGTAAILVEEFNNGSSTHLIKAIERLKQLRNLASSGKLGFNDLDVVEALIDDLEYAVSLFD